MDVSFRIFSKNFLALFSVAFLIQALTFGFVFGAAYLAIDWGGDSAASLVLQFAIVMLPVVLLAPLGTGVSTKLIADRYLGEPTGIGAALKFVLAFFLPLLGAILISGLLTGIGYLLLVLPGIYLMLRFSLVAPAAIVERRGGMAPLRRSGELVRGSYGKLFMLFLVLTFFNIVVEATFNALLDPETLLGTVVAFLGMSLVAGYSYVVWTVTYFERRCALEGFDLQVLAESLGVEGDFREEESEESDEEWSQ